MSYVILFELIAYCFGMLALGFYFNRKGLSQDEFILGGKKIPGWVLAFSERATGESVWLLVAATGFVYASGFSSIWMLISATLAIFVAWIFLSKRFMFETNKYGCLTIPEYLALKFGAKAQLIRWFGGIIIASFFMFYLAAQFSGAGKTLLTVFGLDKTTGMLLAAAIVIAYSAMGGFMSVVWTDMVQSILMVGALVIVPIAAFMKINTLGISIPDALAAAGPGYASWTGGLTDGALITMLIANFSWFFVLLGGQPQLSARFMALRNEKEQKQARNIALIWTVVAYSGVFFIGIFAMALYGPGAFPDQEMLMPHMLNDLLPPWIAGLLLAGILSAIMSTSDSVLLVITSSVTEDIVHNALGFKLTSAQLVKISRVTVLASGAIGLVIGMMSKSLIYHIINWYAAGIGSTFSVAVLMAFFWKKSSSKGIVSVLISGFVVTIIWMSTPLDSIVSARFVTFAVAGILGVVVSLMFPDKKQAEDEETMEVGEVATDKV